MTDASDEPAPEDASPTESGASESGHPTEGSPGGEPPESGAPGEDSDLDRLRAEVEQRYDFDDFGPREMAEMSPEEWEAAFDPETWITGPELLDRVEADLKHRVSTRDVFARVERFEDLLIAYSDSGYAAVYPDGSVEGRGTVLRDVKPTVALASMDSYDVPETPEDGGLPDPQEVPESSDELGNTVLQVVAGVQVLAGLALLGAWLLYSIGLLSLPGTTGRGLNLVVLVVIGIGFLVIGVLLFVMVANARLSDKFRAEEFRNRLRAIGVEDGDRPEFLSEIEGLDGRIPGPGADGETAGADGEAAAGTAAEGPDSDSETGDGPPSSRPS